MQSKHGHSSILTDIRYALGMGPRTPYRPPDVVPYMPRHRRTLYVLIGLSVLLTLWALLNDLMRMDYQRWPLQFESRNGHIAIWWLGDWKFPNKFELSMDRDLRPTSDQPAFGKVGTAFSVATNWKCSVWMISTPHWMLAALGWLTVVVLAVWTWRSGHCTKCGYVLLVTSPHRPCPECGATYSRS